MHRRDAVLAILFAGPALALPARAEEPCCGPITPAGERLARTLDAMDVDHRWLAHERIDWQTGLLDPAAPPPGPGRSATHCSAFAAAAGLRLGVYMLRPPEHSQNLLASAQTHWFDSAAGAAAGWRPIDRMEPAQRAANQGRLVVIAYANPDRHRPGHIVVVRPSLKSAEALASGGPEVIQAATHNKLRYPAARSFTAHPGAWSTGAAQAFVHDVPAT